MYDSLNLSKKVKSRPGGSVTSSVGYSVTGIRQNGSLPIRPDGVGLYASSTHGGTVENVLKSKVVQEIAKYCGRVDSTTADMLSWPPSVTSQWKSLNVPKSSFELGILSWNTNGRLNLRGCRESLLRRWSMKGFVDVGVI